MKYAVLEWDKGIFDDARVISTDQTEESADMVVKISPPYYVREKVTMDELENIRRTANTSPTQTL